MGRQKKYTTDEEKSQARKDRQMRYYWRNSKHLRKEALKRYYKQKNQI